MGKFLVGNLLSGRPHMRERPESLWYLVLALSKNPRGLGNPQETAKCLQTSVGSSETIRVGTERSKI